ncbi:hypothetical protein DV735_g1420, partial [Chaetothyriales sp. CBS 134920]
MVGNGSAIHHAPHQASDAESVHVQGPARGIMELERIKQQLRLRSGQVRRAKTPRSTLQTTRCNSVELSLTSPTSPTSCSPAKVLLVTEKLPRNNRVNAIHGLPDVAKGDVPQGQPARQQDDTTRPTINPPQGRHPGVNRPVNTVRRPKPAPVPEEERVSEHQELGTSDAEDGDFDLRPPAPLPRSSSQERIAELLFSATHLNHVLQEPSSWAKFTRFLSRYKPEYRPLVSRYLQSQKAVKAVEYANALAEEAASNGTGGLAAATLENGFKEASISVSAALVGDALPSYITHCLVKAVTANGESPIIDGIIGELSESFCITDPKQEDNPIIYASQGFYRLTGSGPDMIGRNCGFLQGPKTNQDSVQRLKMAMERGEEHCETLLNYRRDGQPFINLLTIAPLRDNKGHVKYYVGAQVDVSSLVEQTPGLEAFERCLLDRRNQEQGRPSSSSSEIKTKAHTKLRELCELFDVEESAVLQPYSLDHSMRFDNETKPRAESDSHAHVGDYNADGSEHTSKINGLPEILGLALHSASEKLPVVYNAYMLIRPAPSLRIVFISPKLSEWGKIVQTPFLSHVAASATTLVELHQSLNTGGNQYIVDPVSQHELTGLTNGFHHLRDQSPDSPPLEPGQVHRPELHEEAQPAAGAAEAEPSRPCVRHSVRGHSPFQSTEEIDQGSGLAEQELLHRDDASTIRNHGQHQASMSHKSSSQDLQNCNPTPPLTPETAHQSSAPFTLEDLLRHAAPSIQEFNLPLTNTLSSPTEDGMCLTTLRIKIDTYTRDKKRRKERTEGRKKTK